MVTFALDTPGTFTTLGSQPSDFIAGADIVDGVYYGCIYGGTWVTMDTTTGVFTTIGPTTDMSGLAYDFTTSTMYGVSYGGTLYTVDLATGATTSVGPTQSTLIALSCDNDGVLYGVNIGGDNIGSIDKTTGAWTLLAPIGFDASYAQDMTCDHSTNTLYWAAYNNSLGAGQLYIFDQTTFALTLVGNFASNHEVAGFAIAAQGSGGGGTEPAGLVSYNLYRDNAIVANIPKTELQYFDLNLFPDEYCYDITAVYDLTFYGGTGTAQSVKEGTACVEINYGYPVPFMEDWTTGAPTHGQPEITGVWPDKWATHFRQQSLDGILLRWTTALDSRVHSSIQQLWTPVHRFTKSILILIWLWLTAMQTQPK
jgi:hypothetical protein